jgi:tetratricopeptide (TPR) repeat protein
LFERGWRWCRRNPAIAAATSAAVAALVIGLGVALWQWQRAEDAAQRAEANATQAKKDFDMAFQTMDQMLGGVTDDHLMAFPHQDMTRVARLEGAVRLYRNLLQGKEARPEVRLALARAHCWLGQLHSGANDQQQSLRSLDEALTLVEDLPATEANDVEHRRLAAVIYTYRGNVKVLQQRLADAETDYRQALARWDALSAERPDAPAIAVGRTFTLLYLNAVLRAMSRLDEAEPVIRQAVALAEALPADERNRSWMLGYGLRDLALTLERNGSFTESERVLERALECFERAAREKPSRPPLHERAMTLKILAQRRTARGGEAERLYEQSLEISERLVAEFPEVAHFRSGLAETLNYAGTLLRLSRPREGEKTLERSVTLWKELVAKFPEIPRYHVSLGGAEHNLAQARAARGDATGARALLEEAIKHQEQVVKTNHEQANTLEFLHNHNGVLADLLRRLGEPGEAERIVLRQQALAHELAERAGKSPVVRVFQARACQNLVAHWRESKQPAEAVAASAEGAGHWRRLAADFPNDPKYASQLGGMLNDWAIALRDQRRFGDMIPLADEAIHRQEAAIRARPEEPTYQQFLCNHYAVRADAHFNLGDHARVAADASALRERLPDRFDHVIWAARVARCIPLAKKDPQLPQEKRDQLVGQYADASMAFLQAAQQKQSKNLPQIHIIPEFEPLRDRPDFQELLALVPKPATKK